MLTLIRFSTAENATDYSLQNTVRQVLFPPTTRKQKYKAKQAIDTFFVRAGDVLSAVLVFAGSDLARAIDPGLRPVQRRPGPRLAGNRVRDRAPIPPNDRPEADVGRELPAALTAQDPATRIPMGLVALDAGVARCDFTVRVAVT